MLILHYAFRSLKIINVIVILISPQLLSICVAHRGNSSEELENSMSAFKSAVEIGADALEFDIHHTKDGVAIVNHDATLGRTAMPNKFCPMTKKISSINYSEIEQNCLLKNGEKFPRFDELLDYLKDKKIGVVIELKDAATDSDLKLLEHYFRGQYERLKIISFKSKYLNSVREKEWDYEFLMEVPLILLAEILPFGASKLDGVDLHFVTKAEINYFRNQGQIVGVWVYDDPLKILKLLNLGVDFVTTNKPRACLQKEKN